MKKKCVCVSGVKAYARGLSIVVGEVMWVKASLHEGRRPERNHVIVGGASTHTEAQRSPQDLPFTSRQILS